MPEPHFVPTDGCHRGAWRRAGYVGSTLLSVFAGISVLGAGAAALAGPESRPAAVLIRPGTHRAARAAQCRALCVSVQAAGTAAPGETVSFGINISPVGLLNNVTVRISVDVPHPPAFATPAFTSCPNGDGTQVCTVGVLRGGEATELQAQIAIPGSAPDGDTATVSATATCSLLGLIGTGSATGSATVSVVTPQPTPHPSSPPPSGGHPGPPSGGGGHPSPGGSGGRPPAPGPDGSRLGTSLGNVGQGAVPPPSGGLGRTRAFPNPAGLFPVISPLPTASGPSRPGHAKAARAPYRASAVADILPFTRLQVSYQAAALAALAIGIVLAVVRLPRRRRRGDGR